MSRRLRCAEGTFVFLILAAIAVAQEPEDHSQHQQHQHGAAATTTETGLMDAAMYPGTGGGMYSSGTSQVPKATPMFMLSKSAGKWLVMLSGVGFAAYTNQTGERGRDKFYSPNWLMPMASKRVGPGVLTLRSMLSFEPLTITNRRYPLLFQTGETAYGVPILNGQHPHDFFMELAASYQIRMGEKTSLNFYGGPRGEPALGPPAFPHRISASENPSAVLAHHYQDSTHISNTVVTAGITHGPITFEVSGFRGREPDERRWNLETGGIDSLSARLTVTPSRSWSGQFSMGRINNRETTHPLRDTLRTTASLTHLHPMARGYWATSLIWGRNNELAYTARPGIGPTIPGVQIALGAPVRSSDPPARPLHIVSVPTRVPNQIYNSYLLESTLRFSRNWVWGRIENVDKDSTLLYEESPIVLIVDERRFTRIQAYTAGYERELPGVPAWLSAGLGGQVTIYDSSEQFAPVYGAHPVGMQLFLRFRIAGK